MIRRSLPLLLVVTIGCARRAMPGLDSGSSSPVRVPPEQAAALTLPQSEAEWRTVGDEAVRLLVEYLRINTTNPPGNEITAARWLAGILAREGIEAQILEPGAGKANVYARIRGDGTARPLLLLNHMDVVLASAEHWSVDPFGGAVRDGYVWGRGALDMKGEGIAQLMSLLLLRRAGVPLRRDVIFLATADEEISRGVGARWIVEQHPELVQDAEFALNEGGDMRLRPDGTVEAFGIGTTEKYPFWLEVIARGTAGHGSRPTPGNPVHRLIRALARIAAYETPLVVTPTVDAYFRGLARVEPDPVRQRWFADIHAALRDPMAVRAITADVTLNAMLRNTISITGLRGSEKTNVIPPLAQAVVDTRLLPGQDPAAFLAELVRLVDDTAMTIRPQAEVFAATESATDTELYAAIAAVAAARHPDAVILPHMLQGFTDSHFFRRLGIASYGISPFVVTPEEDQGVHGNDERVRVDALRDGVRFYFEIVHRVAAR